MAIRCHAPWTIGLVALAMLTASVGCATSNGDPTDEEGAPAPATTTTTSPEKDRPPFNPGPMPAPSAPPGASSTPTDPAPAQADTCIDKDDQGGTETTAKALPDTSDADNSVKLVKGTLNGPVDVDFFKFHMSDTFGSLVQADFQIEATGVEMCVFVKCDTGTTDVSGCDGGVVSTSSIGTKGCCATGPSKVTPKWDCPGFTDNDSAQFYVRVKQAQDKCTSYSWSYRF